MQRNFYANSLPEAFLLKRREKKFPVGLLSDSSGANSVSFVVLSEFCIVVCFRNGNYKIGFYNGKKILVHWQSSVFSVLVAVLFTHAENCLMHFQGVNEYCNPLIDIL